MSALICGSVAYDTVMMFDGRFREHILPDRIHMLNVSFLTPSLRRNFGGCAGNIAYNLRLLGGHGQVLATVGRDFAPYADWMRQHQVSLDRIVTLDHVHTAQAFIMTDADNNQITAFHPGAMNHCHLNRIESRAGVDRGLVGPEGKQGMLEHAQQFAALGIPYLFDPGQGLPMFDGEELRHLVSKAAWVAVNDYEAALLAERTGWSLAEMATRVQALVVTRGAEGSTIHAGGAEHVIPAVKPARIVDPTGCGDAYRAGLLYGLEKGWDWPATGRLASLLGSVKIEHAGTQEHRFDRTQWTARYRAEFGSSPPGEG